MDAYVSKPIRLAALQDAVAQLFAEPHDHDGTNRVPQTEQAASVPSGKHETAAAPRGLINERKMLAGLGGDRELMAEVLRLFIDDSARLMREMQTAAARNNAEAIRQVAHALKGSIANLSSGTARELAAEIERIGKSGEVEGVASLVERLEEELHILQRAAEQLLNKVSRSQPQDMKSASGVA